MLLNFIKNQSQTGNEIWVIFWGKSEGLVDMDSSLQEAAPQWGWSRTCLYAADPGPSIEGFAKNITVQDAVIRRFAVIGEAANALPKDFTAKHKEIEWKKIIGTGNFLVHEYFEIDMRVVWDTIKQDVPKLKAEVTKMLNKNDG
ncbi:MAG: HepT-like ribonuclease domain-containing protein [Candidatus Micrarchaeaceae archaeon]